MILRLVKMVFVDNYISDFVEIFKQSQPKIAKMTGCISVKLQQGVNNPQIFFTISEWETEAHLEDYRKSELFISTWKKVKPMFAAKAEAWSLSANIFTLD
jgi:heme-degrading monooxygenase HmoA